MTLAEEIKAIRAGLGLTWVAFAAKLGVTWRTVANWESGHSRPSQATMMLARTFRPKRPREKKPTP